MPCGSWRRTVSDSNLYESDAAGRVLPGAAVGSLPDVEDLLLEPTGPALLKRQLRGDDIACPAGSVVGDAGCYCAIEEGVVDGRTQTSSITAYCMSAAGHTDCPTWRAEKDRVAAGRTEKLTAKPDVNKTPKAMREDRLREAQQRMVSNTAEGRRFRKRLGLREGL